MLTAAELDAMRAVQREAMPGSAIIQRQTLTGDGMGNFNRAWSNVATVPARLYPQTVRNISESTAGGAQIISETRWFVTLPYGSTVTAADRINVNNRTFEIYQVNNDEMYQTAVRCEVYAFNEEQRT
jgi:head-tail adaptor